MVVTVIMFCVLVVVIAWLCVLEWWLWLWRGVEVVVWCGGCGVALVVWCGGCGCGVVWCGVVVVVVVWRLWCGLVVVVIMAVVVFWCFCLWLYSL